MTHPSPGDVVVRRYFRAGLLTMAHATRFVAPTDLGPLLWGPVGAGYACRRHADGTRMREEPPATIAAAPLVRTTWEDLDVLVLHRTDRPHAVWWCYRDGVFSHWYVNLEDPAVAWSDVRGRGIDTVDHALDLVVTPDGRARWKDVDEFRWATGRPGFWGEERARAIRAEGRRVRREAAQRRFPFDGTWCDAPPTAGSPAIGAAPLDGVWWHARRQEVAGTGERAA